MSITFAISIYFSVISRKGILTLRLFIPVISFFAIVIRVFLIILAIVILNAIVVIFVLHVFDNSFIRVNLIAVEVLKVFDSLLHVFAFFRCVLLGILSLSILLLLLFSKLAHLVPLSDLLELVVHGVIAEVVTDVLSVNLGAE